VLTAEKSNYLWPWDTEKRTTSKFIIICLLEIRDESVEKNWFSFGFDCPKNEERT